MHTLTILLAVLMAAPINAAIAGGPGVCTWAALEDQLLVDMEERDLDHQSFMGSPVFNALLERRDRHFYLEMAELRIQPASHSPCELHPPRREPVLRRPVRLVSPSDSPLSLSNV
jgi:hypothetical protein